MSAPADLDAIDPRLRYVRPEVRAAEDMHRTMREFQFHPPGPRHCVSTEPESEVMPDESDQTGRDHTRPTDTGPPSATGAAHLNRLEELALILRSLVWGEMMSFAEATGSDPKRLHQWAVEK